MAMIAGLTLEEFLKLPETKPATEYMDGEVRQKPMPTYAHSVVERLLSYVFTLYLRGNPLGDAAPEFRCVFAVGKRRRSYVPDFVYVSSERLRGTRGSDPLRGAPDLAVEILSPDDRMRRVMEKARFYLDHGVRVVWLIDPVRRMIIVLTSPDATRILVEDDTLVGGEILPGFSVTVREILPEPEPDGEG